MSKEKSRTPIPVASLVPGAVPAEELPVLWRHSIASYFDAQPRQASQTLPDIHQYHLGKAIFIDCRFPGQTFTRDRGWMLQNDDADHLTLQLFVRGQNNVTNGAHDYTESCDNIYAVNLAYPIKAESTDSEVSLLVLPRSLVIDEVPQLAESCGAIFAPNSASARLFIDHMISLRNNLPHANINETAAIVNGTLGLLNALTLHNDIGSSVSADATFRTACRYIDGNLGHPSLGVESICEHLHCSRATLYRLFKTHGGVRQHIQRRRLIACFKRISAPSHRHRRIFDIALDFGFTSPSHFSHLFYSHFGITPREAREASLGQPLPEAPIASLQGGAKEAAERMWLWGKTLAGQSPT